MRPLEDLRILAIEQYGAGPFGSVILADLGADVIKIEDPLTGGDVGHYVVPHQVGTDSLFFQTFNRNKRSVSLDLTSVAGRAVFEDLVRISDVVYSNLRGDVPVRLGVTYENLRHLNPAIVCVSLSAYGMHSSKATSPGYDYMFQAEVGWMSLTGETDGPPAKSGLSLVDFSAGYVAAITLLAAVHAARRDGVGTDCDLSLYDVAMHMLTYPATWYLTMGDTVARQDRSAHPSLVPFQNFPTATSWIVIGCAKEKFWQRLVAVLDRADLAADPRFLSFELRRAHKPELIAELDRTLATRPGEIWLKMLGDAGVPCAPIRTIPEALADPFAAERELIIETPHPHWGAVRQVRPSVRVGSEPSVYLPAPGLNDDADEVLGLLGYDAARIDTLTHEGAFGPTGAGG